MPGMARPIWAQPICTGPRKSASTEAAGQRRAMQATTASRKPLPPPPEPPLARAAAHRHCGLLMPQSWSPMQAAAQAGKSVAKREAPAAPLLLLGLAEAEAEEDRRVTRPRRSRVW